MKRRLLFALLYWPVSVWGQTWTTDSNPDSTVFITRPSHFSDVVRKQQRDNRLQPTIPGYRVQIYFGVNRPKASEVKLDFVQRYPDMSAYLTYQQPNYKVRVGDFINRFEALRFMKQVEGIFPTVFVVPDEVKLPEVK